jgi:hypothetical protein
VRVWGLAALSLCLGCSSTGLQVPPEAGDDVVGHVSPDGTVPPPDAGARLQPHDHQIVTSVQLGVIYVADVDAGGALASDSILQWLVASPYWGLLDEYQVQSGSFAGSVRVPTSALLDPTDIDGTTGLVDVMLLDARVERMLHGDADAGSPPTASLPGANAYLIYLPTGVNVAIGHRGSYTYQTCIDADGYHAFDGQEPYVVLPPCDAGRTLYAASHELVEMATDPSPYHGWASDIDIPINGGEIADLCPQEVMQQGVVVTQVWSNLQARCIP